MERTHILIDFENVQPQDMSLLRGDQYRVIIFRGPHQNKLDFDMAESLQPLGSNVTHVQSDRQGKNALDFHIAFYLGRLLQEHVGNGSPERKTAKFIVVSKDGGFDTLLSHVQALGHTAMKAATIREALGLGAAKKMAAAKNVANDKNVAAAKKSAPPKVVASTKQVETPEAVPQKKAKADVRLKLVANFREYPKSRPSTRAALERHIGTALGGVATPSAVQDLIAALERDGVLKVSGDKVEYAAS